MLLVKVLPFGPEPVMVYLVTSSKVLSDGSSVLLPFSTSVERMSRIVVVPGFSEHDDRNAIETIMRINAFATFMIFLMFCLHALSHYGKSVPNIAVNHKKIRLFRVVFQVSAYQTWSNWKFSAIKAII